MVICTISYVVSCILFAFICVKGSHHLHFTMLQAPGVSGPQNQYANQAEDHHANQAPGVQWSQNHYAYQAQAYPQKTMNSNHAPLSNPEDPQRTVDPIGRSSNTLLNHVSENFQPNLQGSMTTNTSSESKIQIPTNPRIAPGFSMVIPKSEKKNLGPDVSKKPAYVSVSMPTNDAKATQVGHDAVMFCSLLCIGNGKKG